MFAASRVIAGLAELCEIKKKTHKYIYKFFSASSSFFFFKSLLLKNVSLSIYSLGSGSNISQKTQMLLHGLAFYS